MKKVLTVMLAFLIAFLPMRKSHAIEGKTAYLLGEANAGIILEEENADEQLPAAGMIRLMSCLLFFENFRENEEVRVSAAAAKKTGTRVFLDAGAVYPYEKLLEAVVWCGANDAAAALAEHLFGTEEAFAEEMNKRAAELGLSAKFADATGLIEEQRMSARDIFKIAQALSAYPKFFQMSGNYMGNFTHNSGRETEMVNPNRLVRTEKIDGMATASSKTAGYCIAASLKSGQARYIAVVLGEKDSNSRFQRALSGLSFADAKYTLLGIAKKGVKIGRVSALGAEEEYYPVCAAEDLFILCERGQENGIKKEIMADEISAPMFAGDLVGRLVCTMADGEVFEVGLILGADVRERSFGSVLGEILKRFLCTEMRTVR
ncbi:MAG: D-alanyl-D-alanine carboxypeptidase [Clostridiales bacterium]|nr:D-alanyl-D-alanine carboxypeptidase [Clostridiales bacterium]